MLLKKADHHNFFYIYTNHFTWQLLNGGKLPEVLIVSKCESEGKPIEVEIIPLNQDYLQCANKLVNNVFLDQSLIEKYSFWVYSHNYCWLVRIIYSCVGVREFSQMWIGINKGGKVIAITGLYSLKKDAHEAMWLAWFCVTPQMRGFGIGTKLLQYSIDRAREAGKKYLRLYTSDDSNEMVAQHVYEKMDFKIVATKPKRDYTLVFREKKL